jgi:hypothetical protein
MNTNANGICKIESVIFKGVSFHFWRIYVKNTLVFYAHCYKSLQGQYIIPRIEAGLLTAYSLE